MPQLPPNNQPRPDAIRPGIDLQWPVSDQIVFNQLTYEGRLASPRRDVSEFRDAALTIRLKPIGMPPLYPDNIHLYLASPTAVLDVTEAVLAELRILVDEGLPGAREAEYKTGLESWLSLIRDRSNLVGYGPQQVATEMGRAGDLVKTQPLSKLLNRLGDRSAGYGGSLHLSNFLYDSISLPPMLLSTILNRYNAGQSKAVTLKELYPVDLIVSYGKLRSVDPNWQRISDVSGAVQISVTWFFSNELLPEFEDLEHKIKTRIVEINTKLGASGDIQQALASLSGDLRKIIESSTAINKVSSDTQKQLASIQTTLDTLASKLVSRL